MTKRLSPLVVFGFIALGGVNAWLVTTIVTGFAADEDRPVAAPGWSPQLTAPSDAATGGKPIGAYADTLARPVFFKTRQPFVPPPPPPPPKVVAPPPVVVDPGLVLGGVMIERNRKKAYLFTKSNPAGTWAAEGEDFIGWKLISVNASGATLQQQGRMIELQLYPKN